MFGLALTDKEILNLAANNIVYQTGVYYAQMERVSHLLFDPEERLIKASVTGKSLYTVQVFLKRDGSVRTYECSCPAYRRYSGACKHVIAVLKIVQDEMPETERSLKVQKRAGLEFLTFFNNRSHENYREELTMELALQIQLGKRTTAQLQLKLGLQRLYVVKDIGEFLHYLKEEQPLEFGKQFTLEPLRQAFKEEDRPVIAFLQEMYEQYSAWWEMEYPYSSSPYSRPPLFSKKFLHLHGIYLKKFLDALGQRPVWLEMGSPPLRLTHIVRQGLPLEFSLQAEGQDLALVFEARELPIKLTPDGSYFSYQQEIYQATPAQQEALPSILKAFQREFTKDLLLPAAQKEFFVSEALPVIEKVGKVLVEPTLAEKFSRENLVSKIYFERSPAGSGIAARVEFHYGDKVINPFVPSGESRNIPDSNPDSNEAILIRAVEKERELLNILEKADFNVNQGRIHLDDEQKVYEFITTYLSQLQGLAEIYYADDFKLTIRTSTSFTGRVRLDENLDLLEVSFQYNDINQDELTDIFKALHLRKRYYRLRDGSFLDLDQAELEEVAQLWENLNLKAEDFSQKVIHLPKFRALYIDNYLRQANLPGIQRNKAFKQLVQNILEPQDSEFELPSGLQNVLRDYQKTGFKWLKTLASYGLGGILADDMGLGKTLQVLSFILSERGANSEPVLVIAPTSVVYNWQEEAGRFTPELKALVVEGNPRVRQAQLADIEHWDLVITSYPVLRRDIDYYTNLEFSYCFLDEAQHIKNPHTINAKSVQQIKAKGYFALTGTPIENSLSELWSIFNFIMPGYLLSHPDFRKKYEVPIIKGEDPKPLQELGRQVTPFILRRLKKDVLKELPEKIETRLKAEMTEEQAKIYLAFLQEARKNIAREIETVGFEKSQIKILAALTRLRQICCHPAMFVEGYTGESGKMQLFQEILADALESGHRTLVFSQFTSMLDIIQNHLTAQKIEHFYLEGSTKAVERSQMVQAFNAGEGKVFLISLKAGGTGLNLTGADMVIHFDPWWNPAVEEQATDRAHRIGQKNTVQVIKLITQGTIEEKVYSLQEKKKELIQAVIQPGETFLSKLTEEELRELFLNNEAKPEEEP